MAVLRAGGRHGRPGGGGCLFLRWPLFGGYGQSFSYGFPAFALGGLVVAELLCDHRLWPGSDYRSPRLGVVLMAQSRSRCQDDVPPALRPQRLAAAALPPPERSASLLVRLEPQHVAMFRFLLESYGHTAFFTVLERRTALLRLRFSPQCRKAVLAALEEMAATVPFRVEAWPWDAEC